MGWTQPPVVLTPLPLELAIAVASATASTAMGFITIASGLYATSPDISAQPGPYSSSFGKFKVAGYAATAIGDSTTANGNFSLLVIALLPTDLFQQQWDANTNATGYVSITIGQFHNCQRRLFNGNGEHHQCHRSCFHSNGPSTFRRLFNRNGV